MSKSNKQMLYIDPFMPPFPGIHLLLALKSNGFSTEKNDSLCPESDKRIVLTFGR